MSLFDDPLYQWRETYFVFFDHSRRPSADQLEAALRDSQHHQITKVVGDDEGRFESATVVAHEDCSALDISYLEGEDVKEELDDLVQELKETAGGAQEKSRFDQLRQYDARLDVMHFEELQPGEDEGQDAFDPTALLFVMRRLAKLTGGVGVDPQSGTIL